MSAIIVALITTLGVIINTIITNKNTKKIKEDSKIQKVIEDNNLLKSGMLSIIRSQIISKCDHYQKQGFLPEYARYCLEELYKNYQKLGGNHGIEIQVNKTFELPLSKDKP